jgi:hypothetical protein
LTSFALARASSYFFISILYWNSSFSFARLLNNGPLGDLFFLLRALDFALIVGLYGLSVKPAPDPALLLEF